MKFNESAPIYLQIIEDIKSKIITGEYQPGQRIDSVRDMALDYGINPNTIQKALAECENQNLLYNEGPNGRFISEDTEMIEKLKEDQINLVITECIKTMKRYGLSIPRMIQLIQEIGEREN
ncbi:MAG: GntR family transcriptional regulator [Erysipelothrix sp.]|jgi:DNA-binding transcriptional regulator YhcF (GntR family)|nr:GntR family transcriptional regulator [Erysipelothrix sp.]